MRAVYQITGAARGENGDCFQACIASVFDMPLCSVPNFMAGAGNGKLLPKANLELLTSWLAGHGVTYVELGYVLPRARLLEQCEQQFGNQFHFLLTGRTAHYTTHTVVCRGGGIVHDPATSPGNTVLTSPCHDGYWRVGLFVRTI